MCLQTLAPNIPYQMIKPEMLDLSSIVSLRPDRCFPCQSADWLQVARRSKDTVKLISTTDGDFEQMKGDFRPSFNTLGQKAFTFHLRPHLDIIERRELQAFWASLPTFDPSKPNHNPARPCRPAAPRQVGPALWDWSEMLQPARWFICPCALAGHACAFTGEAPVDCRGWHDVCTEQVSGALSLDRDEVLFLNRSAITVRIRGMPCSQGSMGTTPSALGEASEHHELQLRACRARNEAGAPQCTRESFSRIFYSR